jgi:hypothetical protein
MEIWGKKRNGRARPLVACIFLFFFFFPSKKTNSEKNLREAATNPLASRGAKGEKPVVKLARRLENLRVEGKADQALRALRFPFSHFNVGSTKRKGAGAVGTKVMPGIGKCVQCPAHGCSSRTA